MQTLFWDSRIRTLVVLLPAMGVLAWIASELASEEFIFPAVIIGLFVVLVLFTVFVQTIRFESVILCMLLVGYLVGNRGFADLAVVKPLFPGEMALGAICVALLVRFALTREMPDFSGWIARVILIYCAIGAFRLALDYQEYRMDALRDSAMVYYAAYYFFGRQLVVRPESRALLERCLAFAFLALVPIAIIWRVAPDLLIARSGFNPLFQKDDLLTTFAAVAVFIIYTRPTMYRWRWVRATLILFYMVYVVSGVGRASLAALIAASVLMFLAGKPRFFLYPAIGLLLGLTVLTGFAISIGGSQTNDAKVFVEKVESMIDVTGESSYHSDYGDLKAGTNDFRRKLWTTFIEETDVYSPLFGRGFGYNFVTHFEDTYHLSEAGQLRSAHNFYITLYGRMGWTGIAVFAVLTVQIIVGGIRAALMVKHGKQPLVDLGYWCAAWVILVSLSRWRRARRPCGSHRVLEPFGSCGRGFTASHRRSAQTSQPLDARHRATTYFAGSPCRCLRRDPGPASAFAVNFQQPLEVLLPGERRRLPPTSGNERLVGNPFRQQPAQVPGRRYGIIRGKVQRRVSTHFRQAGDVRANHRAACGHRFQDREAKPLDAPKERSGHPRAGRLAQGFLPTKGPDPPSHPVPEPTAALPRVPPVTVCRFAARSRPAFAGSEKSPARRGGSSGGRCPPR